MNIKELKPKKALNKAFLKVKPNRTDIECFKANLIQLLDRTNDTESEEFHKNLVSDFLKKTYYDPAYFINTKGRKDLVIHNGNNAASPAGVIIEAKKPTNKSEMITTEKLNAKAFHELMLYYLGERITHKNLELKQLVITNINEWFIFDATLFERLFAENKSLVKQFNDFEGQRLSGIKTDFFYKQIAEPFLANLTQEIEFTYFDIRDYQNPLRNSNKSDDNKLIALFKLLSPEHLLKLPFANDSNSLDKRFYTELIHIIGLAETKEGSKKIIGRNKEGERNSGSILEDAIIQLDSLDKISRLDNPNHFGATNEERLFNIALELSITWINRILFLKLLEAQLISYHKGNESFSFLNFNTIKNFDDLNSLFFQVLARKFEERNADVKQAFQKVPYLNSSLFEPTEIEQQTLFISNLKDDKTLPVLPSTVLKNEQGKKRTGHLTTLQYLFEFLNAYDFSSEGSEEIQEDNKTLINASVLGLIFEKINGYKEGSFFTPGFITMYMCHETIRKAVIQKFSEYCLNHHDLQDSRIERIEDIYDLVPKSISRAKANEIINSIKICDPAVGSGHFLVSALNEMIAVKSYLKILEDKTGKSLNRYEIQVVNDELIITNEDGDFFDYHPNNAESQRIQETLFHEKQRIIENCLFGVDINPNSVKICRLRLWIELLKNAYYKNATELETLPNIDINIKCGNSLVSRFTIDADLSQALKKSKWTIDSYRIAVDTYRNAENKEQKRQMERMIGDIKNDFVSELSFRNKEAKSVIRLRGEVINIASEINRRNAFRENVPAKMFVSLEKAVQKRDEAEKKIQEIENNKIYENAFEWRFEFPEVLDDNGKFVGFDVVIGNPPYIRIQEQNDLVESYKSIFRSAQTGNYDIYVLFIEKSIQLLKYKGNLQFILPHKFLISEFGKGIRTLLYESQIVNQIIHFGHEMIFEGATTYTCLLSLNNIENSRLKFAEINTTLLKEKVDFIEMDYKNIPVSDPWIFKQNESSSIIAHLRKQRLKISDVLDNVFSGIQTSADQIYSIVGEEINGFIIGKSKLNNEIISIEKELVKPLIKGDDIKRYSTIQSNTFVIFPYILFEGKAQPMSEDYIKRNYPFGYEYLKNNENLLRRREKGKMDYDGKWFLYNYPKNLFLSNQRKLVSPDITFGMNITKELGNFCLKNGAYGIIIKPEFEKFENEIIAVLNSKLLWFFLQNTGNVLRGGYFRFNTKYVISFPLPDFKKITIKVLSSYVEKVFEAKKLGDDTTNLEHQIDQLVYQLYDLTEEEIEIVENGSK